MIQPVRVRRPRRPLDRKVPIKEVILADGRRVQERRPLARARGHELGELAQEPLRAYTRSVSYVGLRRRRVDVLVDRAVMRSFGG